MLQGINNYIYFDVQKYSYFNISNIPLEHLNLIYLFKRTLNAT